MMNKEKLLKIFEKYKNESTGGIYMTKWDSMADDILSSQNDGKPLVSSSLPLEQLAEKIIDSLDDCSRDYGSYEYGLPMINDEEMQKMKAIVVRLLSGNAS